MSTALPATVAEALTAARVLGVDRLDAQWLLAHHLGRPRSWLLAHDTDALRAEVAAAVLADLQGRASGVPLAYLTGTREFHGLELHVTPDVLDPRPDTEILVDWALELLAEQGVTCKMIPVPRQISSDCGVCIRIPRTDVAAARAVVAASRIQVQDIVEI